MNNVYINNTVCVFRQNDIHIFVRENRAVRGERGTRTARNISKPYTGTGHRGCCVLYANNCDPVQTMNVSRNIIIIIKTYANGRHTVIIRNVYVV